MALKRLLDNSSMVRRTVMFCCTVCLCAILAPRSEAGDDANEAVEHLKKHGVEVRRAAPLMQFWLQPADAKSSAELPLRIWFDNNWKPRQEDLEYLSKVPNLYGVTFQSEGIREEWLRVLENMPHLKEVVIVGAQFGEETTRFLAKLKELNSLNLNDTSITDRGLENLKELRNLEFLSLWGTEKITDKGFRALHVKKLRFLNLEVTHVKDNAALKDATQLEYLWLMGHIDENGFSANAGLRHLSALQNLQRLDIGSMDATTDEMDAILSRNSDLDGIKTSDGKYTRQGFITADGLVLKIEEIKKLEKSLWGQRPTDPWLPAPARPAPGEPTRLPHSPSKPEPL